MAKNKRKRKPKPKRRAQPKRHLPMAIFSEGQRFSCRDCPARCCRLPWGIRFSEEETERYLADDWVRERLDDEALAVLQSGVLPMRERGGLPQCVFLDDDELCGMQKEHGHAFIPRACQTFPFGFVRDERDRVLGHLSGLCPSVRDDYGEPAEPQLPDKLEQQGEPERMSTAMGTLDGIILPRAQYLRIVEGWRRRLEASDAPLSTVADLFDWMRALERALPGGNEKVSDETLAEAMHEADDAPAGGMAVAPSGPGYHGRMLFAQLLGNLCRPARLVLAHRVEKPPWWRFEKLRAFVARLKWLLGRGRLDMMFVDGLVSLSRARRVRPPVRGELGSAIARFLAAALERRQLLSEPRQLQAVLLDLAFAAVLASRFARCRAAAERRDEANLADTKEGIGVAELLVVSHAHRGEQSEALKQLRWTMLSSPGTVDRLLAAEAG